MAGPWLRYRSLDPENKRFDNLVRCGDIGHVSVPNDRRNRTKHASDMPFGEYTAKRVVGVLLVLKQMGADMRYERAH